MLIPRRRILPVRTRQHLQADGEPVRSGLVRSPVHYGLTLSITEAIARRYEQTLMYHDQQPNEEAVTVTLTRKELSAARRLLRTLVGVDRQVAQALEREPLPISALVSDREILLERARDVFLSRRRRSKVFGRSMFGEAAWDMLLALYIMERSGPRHTVGDLMKLSGTPTTTANRWLAFLVSHGFVRREEHPTDRRTSFAMLTDLARTKMDEYFSETP